MSWRAREITIVGSLALHGVIGWAALQAAHERKARRATTVALADTKKPPPKKVTPPPAPPAPPPAARPRPPAPHPTVAPAPAPVATPAAAAAAPAAGPPSAGEFGNDPGMDLGTGHGHRDETRGPSAAPVTPRPPAAAVKSPPKLAPPPAPPEGAACPEPPGKPEPTMRTEIEYTEEARAAGIQGRLVLVVTVDADGAVTDVKVVAGVDPALDAAAVATVKTWRFKPALACGKPVAGGTFKIARRFELGD
jgi:protein TonB